jgi:hypothetical protein
MLIPERGVEVLEVLLDRHRWSGGESRRVGSGELEGLLG